MTELTIDAFEAFFAELNGGHEPYPWQSRLARDIAVGDWSDQLVAPTGAGKSALVEMLLFLRALAVAEGRSFPRRFVLTVGRRALVDSQASHGVEVARRLAEAGGGVLALVRKHLAQGGSDPVRVTIMRGGIALDSEWLDDPVGCQLIFATPDLLGSRLLFRGYLARSLARPRHAGLLAYDTVAVVDESHLNRQLVRTLRRIGELASRSPLCESLPPLRVIETTATPAAEALRRVVVDDSGGDERLERRLTACKVLEVRPVPEWPAPRAGRSRTDFCERLAEVAQELRDEADGIVGVILNRVRDAVDVAEILDRRGLRVQILVGAMRPYDREQLERRNPGLLTPGGNENVDVLVATQTIEVGVDLDLHGLVTEAAPGTAFTQRVGRANRRGEYDCARIVVFGPEDSEAVKDAAPYEVDDIAASMAWLRTMGDGGDLSPQALSTTSVPQASSRRLLLSRLEPAEAALLSRTSEELFAEPDLDLWLRDDLDPVRPEVSVVGRCLPIDPAMARELLLVTPPQPHELYPARVGDVRRLLGSLSATDAVYPAYLWRAGQLLEVSEVASAVAAMAPGDIVVLEAGVSAAFKGVFVGMELSTGRKADATALGDVLSGSSSADDTPRAPAFTVLLSGDMEHAVVAAGIDRARLLTVLPAAFREAASRQEDGANLTVDDVAAALPVDVSKSWRELFECDAERAEIAATWILPAAPDADDAFPWLVVARDRLSRLPSDVMQEQSPGGSVKLSDHQRDVGDRAEHLADALGLPAVLKATLGAAGRHHDDGKVAREWQLERGMRSVEPLAKSPKRTGSSRRRRPVTGLPVGWRHEQLSVALAWEVLPHEFRPLASRLIGTSHGHGRMTFPHGSVDVVREDQAHVRRLARELFDLGGWDELIDQTDRHWGVWGAAYLEAVLRAADVQVSKEGR